MPDLPTGTVTLLFTDIEGSTRLVQELGPRYPALLQAHQAILRAAFAAWRGHELDTQGDSFSVVFARASDAVQAAVEAQKRLADGRWQIRVRMGIHTGEPVLDQGRYIGLDMHRAARFCAAAHGGQALLSEPTRILVERALPEGVSLRDLGEHRLKDLRRPWRLYQLVIDGLPTDFPPLKTLSSRPNNLTTPLTPLIGRETERASVIDRLRRTDVRLVTLLGPGGVGKTRLALDIAAEMLDEFPDGVYFVPLAEIRDPGLVLSAIAQTLGVREQGGRSMRDSLTDHLRPKSMLLVADNFEQVSLAATDIAELLTQCSHLKMIVTSRSPLRVRGERELLLHPLAVPPERESGEALATHLISYPAMQLFVERAVAARQDFTVNPGNAATIAAICRRLDGLPLALELAAARIRLLQPQAMLARLDQRLRLLTGGARDLPGRHQTLRATLDWSHDLLDDDDRTLFRRLAVFAGGFSLAAAETIVGSDLDVLDGLDRLVNESLVIQVETASGDPRFRMLETIREYAAERLAESGEARPYQQAHADYCLALAEEAEPHLTGRDQAEWLARLATEHDNLRASLTWARDQAATEVFLRLAVALYHFWYLRGHLSEGRGWLESALAGSESLGMIPQRAKGYNELGSLAYAQGDYAAARASNQHGLEIFRVLGNKRGMAASLNNLGGVANDQGAYATARRLFEESLALKRELGNQRSIANTLNNLGEVVRCQGDYATAETLLRESLAIKRQLGDQWGEASSLINLAEVYRGQGDLDRAATLLEESLTISRAIEEKRLIAFALDNQGWIACATGQVAAAETLFKASLELRREVNDRRGIAAALNGLGRVEYLRGMAQAAHQYYLQSLELRQQLGDLAGIVENLEGLAYLASGQGQAERALRLFCLASRQRQWLGIPRSAVERETYDKITRDIQNNLGLIHVSTVETEVEAMTWEQGIEYAKGV